jgi:thiamine-phosphate pyrophosphorylase
MGNRCAAGMPEARIETTRAVRVARVTGLYAVTPDLADTDALVRKTAAALAGGASIVQYRNKAADRELRMHQASTLARLVSHHNALFIVNDDADIAADVNADGVHVGDDDADIAVARTRVGTERLVGASCYDDFNRASAAVASGADYVAFGSFFPSPTKPGARRAERTLLTRAHSLGVPVVAIGGITSANAQSLVDAGADAVAVIADVFAHENPEAIRRAAGAFAALYSRDADAAESASRLR